MSTSSASEKIISGIAKLNVFAINNNRKNNLYITVKVGGTENCVWFNVWQGKWHEDVNASVFTEMVVFGTPTSNQELESLVGVVLADGFLENLTAIGNA